MPTIACPGCGKRYNLPANAAGQVAKCACGKRFRVGAAAEDATKSSVSSGTVKAASKPEDLVSSTAPPVTSRRATSPTARNVESDDEFWDEALKPSAAAIQSKPSSEVPTGNPASLHRAGLVAGKPVAKPTTEKKRKAKPKKGTKVYWGADWGKVIGGSTAFVIFGGITYIMATEGGRIPIYAAGAAVVGLFTALSGLMGEEGIW